MSWNFKLSTSTQKEALWIYLCAAYMKKKKQPMMLSRKASRKQHFLKKKSSLTSAVQALQNAICALVPFFLLPSWADPKYTRSSRDVSSPACVRALKCFHLDLLTPAWSQRSLKVEDGTGPEFSLLFARPPRDTQLGFAPQPARRRAAHQ